MMSDFKWIEEIDSYHYIIKVKEEAQIYKIWFGYMSLEERIRVLNLLYEKYDCSWSLGNFSKPSEEDVATMYDFDSLYIEVWSREDKEKHNVYNQISYMGKCTAATPEYNRNYFDNYKKGIEIDKQMILDQI